MSARRLALGEWAPGDPERSGAEDTGGLPLPSELQFLNKPECNPDLNDQQVKKLGFIRKNRDKKRKVTEEFDGNRRCGLLRQIVGFIVLSWPVQAIMFLVIIFDLVLTIIQFANVLDKSSTIVLAGDLLVIILLSMDVFGRWFAEGRHFLRHKLNVFEIVLVPVTVIEVAALDDFGASVPLLRALRPLLRASRVLRIFIRSAGKGRGYLKRLRHTISGDRVRFIQDGFDLDLAYISSQLIAMPVPGVGYESILRNPYQEVARFLNERHGNKYLLLNSTTDRRYPTAAFFQRVMNFPIAHQGIPPLADLLRLCQLLDCFLNLDPQHVIAVHSRHGQGRVGLVLIALLLYRGAHPSVSSCISHFEHNRVHPNNRLTGSTQTLDNASQRRILEYFSKMCRAQHETESEARTATLRKIQIFGLPNVSSVDVCCFSHPGQRWIGNTNEPKRFESEVSERSESKDNLMERVKAVRDEGIFDSLSAGATPMKGGPPKFSTLGASPDGERIRAKMPEILNDPLVPAIWEFSGLELSGEIRFEFHRRASEAVVTVPKDTAAQPKHGRKLPRRPDMTARPQPKVFTSGMLFSCWFHTGFLEYDEPSQDGSPYTVTVVLDRFGFDKAANAPTLRSHSSALRVEFEYEVSQKIEWTVDEDEDLPEVRLRVGPSSNMSDSYTLEWLTWVSQRVWPSFTTGFERLIRDNLMPSLKESMPSPFRNIRLAQCSFGESYPKFASISACSRSHDGLEVQLDINLNYSTATNIVLETGFASFGISQLKINGVLSLRFKPITASLPVFVAMQLLFLNPPEVDLRFARNLEIANSSMVRNVIFGAINRALFDLMVLPNIININWADPSDDSSVTFRNVLPCAVIRMSVTEGRDLYLDTMFKRAPDVFSKVTIGGQSRKTDTIAKNSNPVWNTEFDLLVYDERQFVKINVVDIDFSGRHHTIGKVPQLPVLDIVGAGQEGLWVSLQDPTRSRSKCGEILVAGVMYDLQAVQRGESDPGELVQYMTSPTVLAEREPSEVLDDNGLGERSPAEDQAETDPFQGDDLFQFQGAGAVAMLSCEIFGGRLPPDLGTPSATKLKASLGKAVCVHRCTDAQKVDPGNVSEKAQKGIERLADMGWQASDIAESLGEDEADVLRIMRKRGWNMECPQKICLLLHEADLANPCVDFTVLVKNKTLATGSIPLMKVIGSTNGRHSEVISCASTKAASKASAWSTSRVELDAELRMFLLKQRTLTGES